MLLGWNINDEEGFDSLDSSVVEEVVEAFDGVVDYCSESPMVMMIT
jgi:hypothetical protein